MKPVVLVMSDVVGSTALWEAHGDSMRAALEQHDELVRGAIDAAGGRVFKHTGDGMIAVFDDADADNAAAAALSLVAALAAAEWGATGPLEVRVSVHGGTASERDGDFYGSSVNKVARINGVGHPGQVLVSDVARHLMSRPAGVDLGMHQLRDLSDPVRLWQFDDGSHPPLRTLKSARHNLPVMVSEFIGRQTEIDELRGLVARHRLVTITGVGGCGKTRLAVEVGAEVSVQFPGGVWFVDLTLEGDGRNVGLRALAALGLPEAASGGDPVAVLGDATTDSATLLIVDNCEHLIDDVADFAESVLANAPSVTVLATSRESLSVDGEHVWRIPNLHDAAVELFIDRAHAAGVTGLDDHFDRIAKICRQLDDIPLAIELAAARVSSLSIDELADRLDDRFSLLGGGRGRRRQRQQTLQAMMDWSYGLLTPDEQTVLNHLAVFAGTFSLSGAEAVAMPVDTSVLDALDSLVGQSLVVPSVDSGRYRLLETVRLYALDQLLVNEQLAAARDRHLAWADTSFGQERFYASFGRERNYAIDPDAVWAFTEEQLAEFENTIAAMEWAEQRDDQKALFSLFIGNGHVWQALACLPATWLERVPRPPADQVDRVIEWLQAAAQIHLGAGNMAAGFERAFEAAAIFDELFDAQPRPSPPPMVFDFPYCVFARSMLRVRQGDFESVLVDADRMLSLHPDAPPRLVAFIASLIRAIAAAHRGDRNASDLYVEAVEVGAYSRITRDVALSGLAVRSAAIGRFDEAAPAALQCLRSTAIPRAQRLSMLSTAVKALTGLGRHDEALEVAETDFGPMIDAQRRAVRTDRLTALALILHELGHAERRDLVAGVAHAEYDPLYANSGQLLLGQIVDVEALPTPAAADLAPQRIGALIAEVVAEIRADIGTADTST